jgi:hypothetical protein
MHKSSHWSRFETAVAEAVSRHQYAKASTMLKEALFTARARDEDDVDQRLYKKADELAAFHLSKGDYQNSASLYRALLELKQRTFGNEHPETERTLQSLMKALGAAGSLSPRTCA